MLNDECASSDATSPAAAGAAAADDKKLQYTLRSNPKRSRRFFDQDYTLELVPLPPAATALKKSSSIFSEKARACTECGKEFPSWKALFGHMRCHPERQWRGIQPPTSMASLGIKDRKEPKSLANTQQPPLAIMRSNDPITNSPTPSTLQSGSEIHTNDDESDTESIEAAYMNGRDPGSPVHGWMTGKRSKRSHHALRSLQAVGSGQMFEPTTPREIMDDRDMADCLVMLAFAGKSKVDDFSGSECDYAPDGKSGQQDGSESLEELDTEGNPKAEKLLARHGGYGDDVESAHLASDVKADRYVDVGWDRKSKFECSTCKKTFRSHQALGGHRASHKKVKGCFARTNTREEGVEEVEMDLEMDANLVHGEKGKEKEEEEEDLEEVEEDLEEARMESRMHYLQCSMNCSEKTEEQDTRKKLKHQSCTSSFMAGTLLIHQQQQHPSKIHQCTICQRIFATGQALGGHKRCHWGGSGSASASEKRNYSELIKKGRQELSSCDAGAGGAVACVCATGVDDRRSLELSSRMGRHDSSSCDDGRVGAVFASAQAWLGGKGRELSKKDSRTWLGGAAEELLEKRSRVTASSTTSDSGGALPVLEMTKKGRSDSGSLDGAAGACWFGASMFEKAMMGKNVDGCDTTTQAEQLLMLGIRPPKDELLDLNLPAPLEEDEEKQHVATIPPLVPAHHSQLPSLTPATFPPPSCFSFLGPAPS